MWVNGLLKTAHIIFVIVLIGGILCRQLARREAHKAADLKTFMVLSEIAGRFENLMVRPGSLTIVLSGIVLALIEGWPMLGILEGQPVNWLLAANLLLISMILVVALIFVPRGKHYEAILEQAAQRKEITPELRASFDDPVVRAAHIYEVLAVLVIVWLMTAKPF